DGADESTSPQVGISLEAPRRWRLVPKTGDARNGGQSLGGARAFLMLIPCYRSPGSAQDLVPKMPWSAAERSIPRMPRAARGTQRVSLVRRTRTRNTRSSFADPDQREFTFRTGKFLTSLRFLVCGPRSKKVVRRQPPRTS